MKSEDKVKAAICEYVASEARCSEARTALSDATIGAGKALANAQRVMHAALGNRAHDGVVIDGVKYWLDNDGRMCSEPFKAIIL